VTFQEKGVWVYGVLTAVVSAVYFVFLAGQIRSTAVGEIGYQIPMVAAIAVSIVLFIVATIAITIASPADADKADQRDKDIDRHGELIGYYVVAAGCLPVVILAMVRADQFWIANAMYLTGVAGALVSSAVKAIDYRRGFWR